jgi:hypothetical protein
LLKLVLGGVENVPQLAVAAGRDQSDDFIRDFYFDLTVL